MSLGARIFSYVFTVFAGTLVGGWAAQAWPVDDWNLVDTFATITAFTVSVSLAIFCGFVAREIERTDR